MDCSGWSDCYEGYCKTTEFSPCPTDNKILMRFTPRSTVVPIQCGSLTHRQSWSLASGGSVEEPQFEFHRLVIQDGQAVVITAVAVEQALYTSG